MFAYSLFQGTSVTRLPLPSYSTLTATSNPLRRNTATTVFHHPLRFRQPLYTGIYPGVRRYYHRRHITNAEPVVIDWMPWNLDTPTNARHANPFHSSLRPPLPPFSPLSTNDLRKWNSPPSSFSLSLFFDPQSLVTNLCQFSVFSGELERERDVSFGARKKERNEREFLMHEVVVRYVCLFRNAVLSVQLSGAIATKESISLCNEEN